MFTDAKTAGIGGVVFARKVTRSTTVWWHCHDSVIVTVSSWRCHDDTVMSWQCHHDSVFGNVIASQQTAPCISMTPITLQRHWDCRRPPCSVTSA